MNLPLLLLWLRSPPCTAKWEEVFFLLRTSCLFRLYLPTGADKKRTANIPLYYLWANCCFRPFIPTVANRHVPLYSRSTQHQIPFHFLPPFPSEVPSPAHSLLSAASLSTCLFLFPNATSTITTRTKSDLREVVAHRGPRGPRGRPLPRGCTGWGSPTPH